MPTLNPRVSVTLQPSTAAVLRRISELTGNSQSALIGQLLEGSVEVFEKMATMLEAAARLKAEGLQASDEIVKSLHDAQDRVEAQLGLVLSDFDAGGRPLLEAAEKVGRRAGRAPVPAPVRSGSPSATPMSNRGVTPQGKASKARAKTGGRSLVRG